MGKYVLTFVLELLYEIDFVVKPCSTQFQAQEKRFHRIARIDLPINRDRIFIEVENKKISRRALFQPSAQRVKHLRRPEFRYTRRYYTKVKYLVVYSLVDYALKSIMKVIMIHIQR